MPLFSEEQTGQPIKYSKNGWFSRAVWAKGHMIEISLISLLGVGSEAENAKFSGKPPRES